MSEVSTSQSVDALIGVMQKHAAVARQYLTKQAFRPSFTGMVLRGAGKGLRKLLDTRPDITALTRWNLSKMPKPIRRYALGGGLAEDLGAAWLAAPFLSDGWSGSPRSGFELAQLNAIDAATKPHAWWRPYARAFANPIDWAMSPSKRKFRQYIDPVMQGSFHFDPDQGPSIRHKPLTSTPPEISDAVANIESRLREKRDELAAQLAVNPDSSKLRMEYQKLRQAAAVALPPTSRFWQEMSSDTLRMPGNRMILFDSILPYTKYRNEVLHNQHYRRPESIRVFSPNENPPAAPYYRDDVQDIVNNPIAKAYLNPYGGMSP